jgi:YD repeat-containing protein
MKRFVSVFLLIIPLIAVDGRTHQYDDQGRLIRVAYEQGGGIAYAYDIAGNMLSTTALSLPATPTNLTVIRNSATETVLSWSDNAENETGYTIYRRQLFPDGVQNDRYSPLATLPANSTGYVDDTIRSQQSYEYWVVATNDDGESAEPMPMIAVDPTPFVIKTFEVEDNIGDLIAVTFTSNSGDVYAIEISTDLIFWDVIETQPDPNIYTGGNGIFLGDFSGDETTVRILLPEDEPNVYIRVVRR